MKGINAMEKVKVNIPENIQNICREFAEVARKHDLHDFSVKFRPAWDDPWGADVHASWEWGRHGDDSNQLKIQSEYRVLTTVTVKVE